MAAYDRYFAGDLANYDLSETDLTETIAGLDMVPGHE